MYRLRLVYKQHKIRLRTLRFRFMLSKSTLERRDREKCQVLPKLIRLMEKRAQILFADEAVFTTSQLHTRVWASKGKESVTVPKTKLSFPAQAVVAATTMDGKIVGLELAEKSIRRDEFLAFLDRVAIHLEPGPAYLLLDNLNMHRNKQVQARARHHRIEIIYNAPYSSELNPCEALWCHAKRVFARHMITFANFKNIAHIRSLINEAINSCPPQYLRART